MLITFYGVIIFLKEEWIKYINIKAARACIIKEVGYYALKQRHDVLLKAGCWHTLNYNLKYLNQCA